jgi:ATP-dependent Clp protease ATP-binding subunit ClpX
MDMDDVELVFEPEAVEAIADKAIERNTGARGLRAIIEETVSDIMFDTPSDKTITKVTVTKECVTDGAAPVVEREEAGQTYGKLEAEDCSEGTND